MNSDRLSSALHGKRVLITGASSGIGEALTRLLAGRGAHLILAARREGALLALQQELGTDSSPISVYPADLRDPAALAGLLAYLHELPGGLDIVVSNAGHSIRRPIRESLDRYHDFTRTMALHYLAPVRLLLSVLPLLERNGGQVVSVSTVNVLLLPVPHWAAYQASKAAFDTWLRSAGPELARIGVAATSLYFPLVRTPMILPTEAYRRWPAMSSRQAARLIGRCLYTRRRVWKPWWLFPGQLASVLLRWAWEAFAARKRKERGDRHEGH
ncbi:SDR family NAD(P)-dependent oxidoreductase [Paenibacillus aurantius]|uniref:SDR family NAD(P)-dependent oxidoreductase n=1 Tax=Paenibacillus aurantius TaxID=2918900 RepID=A0AA96LE09_9BACL|nr:SDR family NAD(P)-dependent oxidoreductase [Paenibacillus aurantius]WNQ10366.1 SDR family NAD(P)-dependent oxidoreductase [Paenibacillus aurantius]